VNRRMAGPPFPRLAVLDRGGHGWVEFAEHADCHSADEVRRFYERHGGYLALLYMLNGTDMHCENVLARSEDPIIVDLEALFHPVLRCDADGSDGPASDDLRRSVVRAGLLPGSMRHGAS